jgi:hypothetical protein
MFTVYIVLKYMNFKKSQRKYCLNRYHPFIIFLIPSCKKGDYIVAALDLPIQALLFTPGGYEWNGGWFG